MKEVKTIEQLIKIQIERPLRESERTILNDLLRNSPEALDLWLDHCEMETWLNASSESFTTDCTGYNPKVYRVQSDNPPGRGIRKDFSVNPRNEKSQPTRRFTYISLAALIILLAIVSALLKPNTPDARPEVITTENAPTLSPQENYEKVIANLPVVASQQRPPTGFVNANHTTGAEVDFNNDIRPILADKCFHCHGPDSESRKADLRLDTEEGAFADLGGYYAIKPGDAENSEVVIRLLEDDPDSVMPPPDFHKALTDREKKLIQTWIASGAQWDGHWAFETIARPEVRKSADNWGKNPIDFFIKNKHREAGIPANPEADKYTLARRAALDLIGLPPTEEELNTFLDDTSPDAYEKYVDRLIASTHYGEHRARFWLDAARYSDTHGMHLDNFREMWPYRDWVINAFNQNQPFDQFAIEQLAGDLLTNPTKPQLIATGFVRNNSSTAEGGSIPEELKVRYMSDRTETMSTVFLGLTAGCAACHDHKYDPISQKEFYQMGAFFNNSTDPPMDGNMRDTFPVVVVPTPEHEAEWNQLDQTQKAIEQKLNLLRPREVETWWNQTPAAERLNPHPVPENNLAVYLPLEGGARSKEIPGSEAAPNHPNGDRGLLFPKNGGLDLAVDQIFTPESPVTITMWVKTPASIKGMTLLSQQAAADKEKKTKGTGWVLKVAANGGFDMTVTDEKGTAAKSLMPSETPLKPNAWQQIAVRYSGGQASSSFSFFVDGEWRMVRRSNDTKISNQFGDHLPKTIKIAPAAAGGGISDLRIHSRWLLDDELKLLADEFVWRKLVEKKPDWKDLSPEEKELAIRYYQFNEDKESIQLALELGKTRPRSDYLYARSPTTLVMKEEPTPAMAHVLIRGEYDQRGASVKADTPAVLPPLNPDGTADRLDLAKWLVKSDHPLTARVTVNRIWQSIFGTGLVKTSEDFGIMGEKPTHPELLDWLAAEFIESGWDVKSLVRLMVTSATYRQDSKVTEKHIQLDPENRYLARGARRRLDAEVIRDQALAVSGILDRTQGGPSVKPYQPSGIWKTVAFAGSNTNQFKQDSLDKLHRRSVYTFWKRTAIHPAFSAFDAPSREDCAVRRERTNTPLQALVLLNDVQHVEAARKLAEYLISKFPDDTSQQRASRAFLRIVGRPATAPDLNDLVALSEMARQQYQSHPGEAAKLASTGDLPINESLDPIAVGAWTLVINALLNRDDVINQS
ncbi:MAG: DUF1553 domain-containing protein [Verrucomicrobiales bacterium]|nr:DUF1553 domain-containing protein [Verrucomicrobiales bacterium]